MIFSFTVPDDFILEGLNETHKGWRVYLKKRRPAYTGTFLGGIGLTPQAAIDDTIRAILERDKRLADYVPAEPKGAALPAGIKLDLSVLNKRS